MKIIEAKIEHIPIVRAMASIAFPDTYKDILTSSQIEYMMNMMYGTEVLEKQLRNENYQFLLAKDNDEYLGYLAYELNYSSDQETKIHKIYILPSAQGKGIGKLFIETIIPIVLEMNNQALVLNVNRFNKAVGFYKNLGFDIAEDMDLDIGNGYIMEDYVMKKYL